VLVFQVLVLVFQVLVLQVSEQSREQVPEPSREQVSEPPGVPLREAGWGGQAQELPLFEILSISEWFDMF